MAGGHVQIATSGREKNVETDWINNVFVFYWDCKKVGMVMMMMMMIVRLNW